MLKNCLQPVAKLTIAIPTFNRPNKVNELVPKIILSAEKHKHRVDIRIADNSTNNGSVRSQYNSEVANIKYIRRPFNIGPTANILRVFEESETDWISIVSDDDDLNEGAVDIMLNDIDVAEDSIIGFKYKSELDMSQDRVITISSLKDFVSYISNPRAFGSMILISSWMFRVNKIKEFIRYSYLYSGLQIPHVCPVLFALHGGGGSVVISKYQTIKYKEPAQGDTWDYSLTFSLMTSTVPLFHLFNDKEIVKMMLLGIVGKKPRTIFGFHLRVFKRGCDWRNQRLWSVVRSISIKHAIINFLFLFVYRLLPDSLLKRTKGVFVKEGINRM
jgi:hypothetical protein